MGGKFDEKKFGKKKFGQNNLSKKLLNKFWSPFLPCWVGEGGDVKSLVLDNFIYQILAHY